MYPFPLSVGNKITIMFFRKLRLINQQLKEKEIAGEPKDINFESKKFLYSVGC